MRSSSRRRPRKRSVLICDPVLLGPNSCFLPSLSWFLWRQPCWCQHHKLDPLWLKPLRCLQRGPESQAGTTARERGVPWRRKSSMSRVKARPGTATSSARKKTLHALFSLSSLAESIHPLTFEARSLGGDSQRDEMEWDIRTSLELPSRTEAILPCLPRPPS